MLVYVRHFFSSSCRDIAVTGRPGHAAAFTQEHLCFFRWANAAAVSLWLVTLVMHLNYALADFYPTAIALGFAPQSAAPVFVAGPILLGIAASSYLLINARGQLSISRAQRLVMLTAAGALACEGLQVGLTHGHVAHFASYTLCNLILFSVAPLRPVQQICLAGFSLALPILVAFVTGYSLAENPALLPMMTLPVAGVVLGLITYYWHFGSFLLRRLAELRLERRNSRVERQKCELERQRQIEQIRIRWLEQMAGFLRHEMRNAVVGASTSLTLLQRRASVPQDDAYLARTRQALRVIGTLLDSVSDSTSVESTLMKETKVALRLQRVVQQQTEVYRGVYPDRIFTLEMDSEDLIVLGRPERLIEVLDNLVSNAVDHAHPGTPIEVRCQRLEGCAVLQVANQGPPLPDTQEIFGLFQSFRDHVQRGDHLGLGLYMVKLIAERYGGRVDARSRTGVSGAEFRVMLPIVS